jgi:hypothetical protein
MIGTTHFPLVLLLALRFAVAEASAANAQENEAAWLLLSASGINVSSHRPGGDGTTPLSIASDPRGGAAAPASPPPGARQQRERYLASISFSGDTTNAPLSGGNAASSCGPLSGGINGRHSLFYEVTGGVGGTITASTCGAAFSGSRIFVWRSPLVSSCTSFECVGA